jgi:hypothetical protein
MLPSLVDISSLEAAQTGQKIRARTLDDCAGPRHFSGHSALRTPTARSMSAASRTAKRVSRRPPNVIAAQPSVDFHVDANLNHVKPADDIAASRLAEGTAKRGNGEQQICLGAIRRRSLPLQSMCRMESDQTAGRASGKAKSREKS